MPKSAEQIVVVTVKGIDPALLTSYINTQPNGSFSRSSSIPVRYCASECKRYVDRNVWRPMDVEDVTALALWPRTPLASSQVFDQLTEESLFDKPVVVAKAWFSQWKDFLLFTSNHSKAFQNRFINQFELKLNEILAAKKPDADWLSELLPLLPSDKIGEFRRSQVADSGNLDDTL
jgi:hypothetical protein